MLLPQVKQRIDEIRHENYHIPCLAHGHRMLRHFSHDPKPFEETDYVDAWEPPQYEPLPLPFVAQLTKPQAKALRRINTCLQRVLDGSRVSSTQLRTALDPEQYTQYLESIDTITQDVEIAYGDGKPQQLISYSKLVRKGDFAYGKSERMSGLARHGIKRYKRSSIERAKNQATRCYERAIERLEELITGADVSERHQLESWLDRPVAFDRGVGHEPSPDVVEIPRVRGSKSPNALDSGLPKLSKSLKRLECQLVALAEAARELVYVQESQEQQQDITEQTSKKYQRDDTTRLLRSMANTRGGATYKFRKR